MKLHNVVYSFKRFGVTKSLAYGAYRVGHAWTDLMILRAVKLYPQDVSPLYLSAPEHFSFDFYEPAALRPFVDSTALTASFLEKAEQKEDMCYAAMDGDSLAAFGWYSRRPAPLLGPLNFSYPEDCVYMYHGYTYPNYRGHRLHAVCMAKALLEYSKQGVTALVSDVEVTNYRSLRSCARLGYREYGTLAVTRLGGRFVGYASPAAKSHGFQIVESQESRAKSAPAGHTPARAAS